MKKINQFMAISLLAVVSLFGIQIAQARGIQQIVVDTTADEPQAGFTTLREAIEEANSLSQSEIIFNTDLFNMPQTIVLQNGEMIITESLSITGPGADLLTIDGDNLSRIFTLDDGIAGAVFTVSIQNVTLTNGNGESSISGGRGGCVYSNEKLRLSSSIIENCSASIEGGGVRMNRAGNTVENSVFLNNTTAGSGGGLAHQSSTGSKITGSTFIGNWADSRGGGLSVRQTGSFDVINSTFSGNQAPIGAGISATSAINISNTTIYSNLGQGVNLAQDNIQNSIIALNSDGDCVFGEIGFNNLSNFSGDGSCETFPELRGLISDPRLGPLTDNGGSTPTHSPLIGSPVIDNGFEGACAALDQRGEIRPQDGDDDGASVCDIGAVEFNFELDEIIFFDGFDFFNLDKKLK